MAHDVTSWFQQQSESKNISPVRKFNIGSSDYSERVLGWPTFSVSWDQVKPVRVTMNLANEDQALNFIRTTKTNLQNSCQLQLGFTHATSGDELMDVFNGTIDNFKMSDGSVTLTLVDKFKTLSQRVMGTSEIPVDFTGSEYLISDLAWWTCTSYGNLSSIESTSNPDIDFATFDTWAGVMSGDNVRMSGKFTGARVIETLRKIARVSKTAIYQEEDKIKFQRFSLTDSFGTTLSEDNILSTSIEIDAKDIINRKSVMLSFDTTSRYHTATIIDQDSASVNSFGLYESVEKDANLWYVNSASAINFAQREILIKKLPYDRLVTKVPLIGMLRSVGEMVYMTDSNIGISGDSYRVMKRSISMDTGLVTINGDASQVFGGFILGTSSLDGVDVLV